VPAFLSLDELCEPGFLSTPLPIAAPMQGYTDFFSADMNTSSFDSHFTLSAMRWMNGFVGGGECGSISRNDAFCDIFYYLGGLSEFSRNRSEDSTVMGTRSDRTDMLQGVTVAMTEEKEMNVEEAIQDLQRKFHWIPHYNQMPFIFGIAISNSRLVVVTLNRVQPVLRRVFQADLTNTLGRWGAVVCAINIARTIKLFREKNWIIGSTLSFNKWYDRNTKRIRLELTFAEVQFRDKAVFKRMLSFYKSTADVPHLEHLYQAENTSKSRIKLVPVGCSRLPTTLIELTTAVRNIFDCLQQLHKKGFVHCDIRWSNVVEYFSEWFVIDCEYACSLVDRKLLVERSTQTIRQKYVKDPSKPWDASFDLYQMGLLLCDLNNLTASCPVLTELCQLLMSKDFTTDQVQSLVARLV